MNKNPVSSWKPGESGNLKGRPVIEKTTKTILNNYLKGDKLTLIATNQNGEEVKREITSGDGKTLKEFFLGMQLMKALSGDTKAAEFISDKATLYEVDITPREKQDLSCLSREELEYVAKIQRKVEADNTSKKLKE